MSVLPASDSLLHLGVRGLYQAHQRVLFQKKRLGVRVERFGLHLRLEHVGTVGLTPFVESF